MYELIQVSEHDYYIESPAKIGLVKVSEDEVVLIDSGNDKSAGRKVRQILDKNNWKLRAIYNTHSHADHVGGNRYLQNQTGCKIYAPEIEADFTNHPILEASYLYGGYAPGDLRHKFLMAQPSSCEVLSEENLPQGFELVKLPGHYFEMVGFRTPDDTFYIADCLSSRETLEKYRIGVLYDVAAYLETLEKLKSLSAARYVPAHAAATEDITELADYNIEAVKEVIEKIREILELPRSFEEVLKALFDAYDLEMNFEQYVLVGSTVRSYLSYLRDNGEIEPVFEDNQLKWKQVQT